MRDFEYHEPATVAEACRLLEQYGGEARVYAGGTGLSILMKQGLLRPKALINIKRIHDLRGIEFDSTKGLSIGALVTHHELETSELVWKQLPILRHVEREVANIRVRNMGTVGGNLASGEPLTDLPSLFISLDARVTVLGASGERTLPLEELFLDYYQTVLADDEILTQVVVPLLPVRTGVEYIRFSSGSVVDKPCVGVSVRISLEPKRRICRDVRIALGCVAPTPMRARKAEQVLEGKQFKPEVVEQAASLASQECSPLDDLRGSESYKREMVSALVRQAVPRAYERAQETEKQA